MIKLINFLLRYLRSKTYDMILKISSKLIETDKNHMKSSSYLNQFTGNFLYEKFFFNFKYLIQNLINSKVGYHSKKKKS